MTVNHMLTSRVNPTLTDGMCDQRVIPSIGFRFQTEALPFPRTSRHFPATFSSFSRYILYLLPLISVDDANAQS
jgi:hypothetical protein